MMADERAEKKFTGLHFLLIFVGAFGVIIAVNLALAWNAVATFPGLEVKNSYVASQQFDERRDAQEALGWDVSARAAGGLLILSIKDADGKSIQVTNLEAVLGRATHVKDDREPEFQFDGRAYVAREELTPGNWNIRMKATALDGTAFEQRVVLHIDEG
ncbi:Nitrogen fixation protein FixH [Shimia marina]|uniref:Putative integral membrane protein linked to a cation pump n=2 Tax=Shimia marina TaxID=321267 RepID=A0A0P1FE51_9RHOB|nr:putative integral membrane protein linked to a cation pump [Shimia marina]SFE10479.1 Nitrogen fixation protein FixH [Shimia marina]